MTGVLVRGHRHPEYQVIIRQRLEGLQLQAKNFKDQQPPPEVKKRSGRILRSLRGAWPADILIWPLELGKNEFLLFEATQFVVLRYSRQRRPIQTAKPPVFYSTRC